MHANSNATSALEFHQVIKDFGQHRVLDHLDFAVRRGETVALIGPSGSGKTTVLRLAMMLEEATAGEIRILDEPIPTGRNANSRIGRKKKNTLVRRCGMVFQQYNLFPHMSVLSNLTLAPRAVLHLSADEAESRAIEYLRLVGLEDKAKAFPLQLSGGQQQRIAIARALTLRPEILLLDEITSALDPELVGEVLEVVRKLARESDITILTVTHEMRFARQVADRIAMFADGKVIEFAPPEQIFTNPQNLRTREFLQSVLEH